MQDRKKQSVGERQRLNDIRRQVRESLGKDGGTAKKKSVEPSKNRQVGGFF